MTETTKIKIPHFEPDELSPKVLRLFEIIQQQGEAIQQLRDEIAVLKGHNKKPQIKPSRMEEETSGDKEEKKETEKRSVFFKKSKTKDLVIHEISSGQIDHILSNGKDEFHSEKNELLSVGLKVSDYVQVDDTGARHDGKNGYCTVICNDYFTLFESTSSKSRINFLELLLQPN